MVEPDIGIRHNVTNSAIGFRHSRVLVEGGRLFTEYKGAYAEQYVCQQIVAGGAVPYCWSADGKQKKGEVDFLVETPGGPLPLEVKADENVVGSSLASFVRDYGLERAVRFSLRGLKEQGWLVNVPLYAANAFPGIVDVARTSRGR